MLSRRAFLAAGGSAATLAALPSALLAQPLASPFKVAVITDEISDDFDHACAVIANEYRLQWVELRGLWGKNLQDLSEPQIVEAQKILAKYNLRVTDIASPLFKVDFPGAPHSQYGNAADMHGAAEVGFSQQDAVLEHSIALARQFKTERIRCFDFWRLDDQAPFRTAINEKLRAAAEIAAKAGLLLVLENEFACNTATGREAAKVLDAVQSPHFVINWDPANAVMRGELDAYPGGWDALPKNRIRHCHCKNAVKDDSGKIVWSPVATGYVDWTAQFRALKQAGYRDAVSLETHWKGPQGAEASSRISWTGMAASLRAAGALAG